MQSIYHIEDTNQIAWACTGGSGSAALCQQGFRRINTRNCLESWLYPSTSINVAKRWNKVWSSISLRYDGTNSIIVFCPLAAPICGLFSPHLRFRRKQFCGCGEMMSSPKGWSRFRCLSKAGTVARGPFKPGSRGVVKFRTGDQFCYLRLGLTRKSSSSEPGSAYSMPSDWSVGGFASPVSTVGSPAVSSGSRSVFGSKCGGLSYDQRDPASKYIEANAPYAPFLPAFYLGGL